MSQTAERFFSEDYLREAGKTSAVLFAQWLAAGQTQQAVAQLDDMRNEMQAMYYNYRGWQKRMLAVFTEREGVQKSAQVLASIETDDAPERLIDVEGIYQRWDDAFDIIRALVAEDQYDRAQQECEALHKHALAVHDGMMSRVTAILSELYRSYGDAVVMQVLREVMNPAAIDPDGKLPFKEKVEKLIFFTRLHLLPFTVVEDDEKATFMPDPCPSGARLIRDGHYEAPRNGAKVNPASALTYQQSDFPIYCCHEPAMEITSILANGVPVFVIDPSDQLGYKPCKTYVYKNNAEIPARFFERLGLEKPQDLIARG